MSDITIRLAAPEDAEALAGLHFGAWQWAYRGQMPDEFLDSLPQRLPWRTARWQEILSRGLDEEQTWVAEIDGHLAGLVSVGPCRDADIPPSTGEVYAIYLAEVAAGKGNGRVLLGHAVAFLRGSGYEAATLWCLELNARARRFYEKAGWVLDGGTKIERFPGFERPAVRYRLSLAI